MQGNDCFPQTLQNIFLSVSIPSMAYRQFRKCSFHMQMVLYFPFDHLPNSFYCLRIIMQGFFEYKTSSYMTEIIIQLCNFSFVQRVNLLVCANYQRVGIQTHIFYRRQFSNFSNCFQKHEQRQKTCLHILHFTFAFM